MRISDWSSDVCSSDLLEPFRDKLSPAVFGPAVTAPVSDGSGQDRKLLRRAAQLLDEAGWKIEDGMRRNAKGEALTVEFLGDDPVFQRVEGPYAKNQSGRASCRERVCKYV